MISKNSTGSPVTWATTEERESDISDHNSNSNYPFISWEFLFPLKNPGPESVLDSSVHWRIVHE